ncbi:unnamed protein product [Cunninghamella blakesleeana]
MKEKIYSNWLTRKETSKFNCLGLVTDPLFNINKRLPENGVYFGDFDFEFALIEIQKLYIEYQKTNNEIAFHRDLHKRVEGLKKIKRWNDGLHFRFSSKDTL